MIKRFLNLLYTIWFNIRYLPIKQAVHLPIFVRTNLRIEQLRRGQIELVDVKPFIVKLGGVNLLQ